MNVEEALQRAERFLQGTSYTVDPESLPVFNPVEGVWIVGYVLRDAPDLVLDGGALAVSEAGAYHIGSSPDTPELQGLVFADE